MGILAMLKPKKLSVEELDKEILILKKEEEYFKALQTRNQAKKKSEE